MYHHRDKQMQIAAMLVALLPITIGMVGIVSSDSLMNARAHLMHMAGVRYVTGSIRIAMGLVLILVAQNSRIPKNRQSHLRHSRFMGLRDDQEPEEVVRGKPTARACNNPAQE
jgi:hypothetical protein